MVCETLILIICVTLVAFVLLLLSWRDMTGVHTITWRCVMVARKVTHYLADSAAAKFPKTSKAAPTISG